MEPYCKSSSHILSKTIYMQSIQNFIFPNTPVPQVYIFAVRQFIFVTSAFAYIC